jgi:hypothetical protein
MRVFIAVIALATTLSGCATGAQFTPSPVGVNGKPNGLRRTPCAGGCGEIRQKSGLPAFLKQAHV